VLLQALLTAAALLRPHAPGADIEGNAMHQTTAQRL